jgi:hypothetical protein
MRASTIGIATCFAVIVSTWGCTTTHVVGSDDGGTTSSDSSSGGGSGFPSDAGAGPLYLLATGGASGEVAAGVALVEPGVGQHRTCTGPLDAGACQLTSCTLGGIGSPSPGYGNFGPISVSVGTTTEPLTYNFDGYGSVDFPSSVTLGTGGTMTFRGGSGTGVPEFDVSATIPGLAVITSPVPTSDGGAAIIDTSQDLSVTWLPISIGQIDFELNGGYSPPGGVAGVAISIACTFGGAAGSGVVPQTLLSSLKEMSGSNPTSASLTSGLSTTTVVDGLTIVTESSQESPSTIYGFNVTLQ